MVTIKRVNCVCVWCVCVCVYLSAFDFAFAIASTCSSLLRPSLQRAANELGSGLSENIDQVHVMCHTGILCGDILQQRETKQFRFIFIYYTDQT